MLMIGSYAIGGLAGGEEKDAFWRVVAQCTAGLPEDKPRYVMVSENKVLLLSATKVQTPSLPVFGFKLCYLPIILRCYLGKMFKWFNTKTTVAGAWHHSVLLPYVPGSGVPTRHCGVQCSRCRHVWLCLSYTDWSIWHCTGARGMSTNTKCSLQKLSFQFSLKRDALEVLPQVKHLDKAVLTQLCLSWVLIILQPGTLEAEACSYGKGLPATRFFLLLHGMLLVLANGWVH